MQSKMLNMIQRRLLYATITAILGLTACQQINNGERQRTDSQLRTFQALNDSMQHLSPQALPLIMAQMEAATDSLTWYDYYLMYGRHYLLSEKPDSLLPYADRVLRYTAGNKLQTPRLRGLAATALNAKAAYHYLLHHHPDTIIALYMQAYQLMKNSDMEESLPDLSANIGDAYVSKGNLPEGSHWYRRALYLVDSLGLPEKQTLTLYMGLGRIYTYLGDFKQAQQYYEMTDRRLEEMKPNMQSYFLNNYGNFYYYQHDYPKAMRTFRRLKSHIERYHAERNFDMFLCKINMADIFQNLGQTDSARQYVEEAEAYFRQQGVTTGVYYAHTIRIGIALQEKRYGDVEKIIKAEDPEMRVDPEMQTIRRNYMNRYYAAIGDYKHAYYGLQGHMEHQISTDSSLILLRSKDIMMRLSEDTIRLHHQLEMNQRQATYDKTRLALWAILATLIVVVLAFILWASYERKRKLKSSYDMLNLRLSNARQRISPHFVFNVLNSRMSKSSEQENDQLVTLAKLIRANLDLAGRPSVSLAEELDFVSHYVKIEQSLIGEDFTFSMDIPERSVLEDIKVPSMLVQILTENAILHGLKGLDGEKRLTIRVETDNEQTRISVCDNGTGFDIRSYNSERSRTGLSIIRTTLNVINQENPKAKIRFDIENDNGCHAILTIPRKTILK